MNQLQSKTQQKLQPKYKFYATLLDAFSWYQQSEQENAFEEFINKINRVPFESEAARKGTAFNNVMDGVLNGSIVIDDVMCFDGFEFRAEIIKDIYEYIQHGIPQVFVSDTIKTRFGLIEVYGYQDYLLPLFNTVDLKTTSTYELPKYLNGWQHIVYPYCNYKATGLEYTFTYLVTDFSRVYLEQYVYNHERDSQRLKLMCEDLVMFIQEHRHLITDKKIFALI